MLESGLVKGSRTPAVDGWLRRLASVGRRPTSLKGGNRGWVRLGGAAGSVYGDLTAAAWVARVARCDRLRGSGRWRAGAVRFAPP